MASLIPPAVALPETSEDDPRIGQILGRSATPESARAVIVGFPSDEGVRINGGRPGAVEGPARLRSCLYRLTPDARSSARFMNLVERTVDLGDVAVTGDVAHDQESLGEVLMPYVKRGAVPIVLGGGHEAAFGHFLAYVYAGLAVEIVNWDAHADVRTPRDGLPHSGSPFRQALRHASGSCTGYRVLGLAPQHTSARHLDFIEANGGGFVWAGDLTDDRIADVFEGVKGFMMTSFDLDAVNHAEAPGVSAPTAAGMSSGSWLRAAFLAGCCPAVSSFDIVELNPRFDPDDRTARLAALTVWTFLSGLSTRTDHAAT